MQIHGYAFHITNPHMFIVKMTDIYISNESNFKTNWNQDARTHFILYIYNTLFAQLTAVANNIYFK